MIPPRPGILSNAKYNSIQNESKEAVKHHLMLLNRSNEVNILSITKGNLRTMHIRNEHLEE